RLPQVAVVPVTADVQRAAGDDRALELGQLGREPSRELIALGHDPDQDDVARSVVALEDLVRDARERTADLLRIHHGGLESMVDSLHESKRASSAILLKKALRACLK